MITPQKLTDAQQQFIRDNRLQLSMNDMRKQIGASYTMIRNYMIEHNLQLTKAEVMQIRTQKQQRLAKEIIPMNLKLNKTFKHPRWVSEPWNQNLNLITMI